MAVFTNETKQPKIGHLLLLNRVHGGAVKNHPQFNLPESHFASIWCKTVIWGAYFLLFPIMPYTENVIMLQTVWTAREVLSPKFIVYLTFDMYMYIYCKLYMKTRVDSDSEHRDVSIWMVIFNCQTWLVKFPAKKMTELYFCRLCSRF